VHGLLGHEGRPPSELLAIGSGELEKYVSVTHSRSEVSTVVPSKGGFEFTRSGNANAFARKVLLATGLIDEVPNLAGIDALYGRSVHHCRNWQWQLGLAGLTSASGPERTFRPVSNEGHF